MLAHRQRHHASVDRRDAEDWLGRSRRRRRAVGAPTSWNATDHLSRQTIRGLVRPEADFVALVQAGSVAELVNPPKSKTSTHASEVARRTTTLPLIFDLLATEPFSMRVLGPLLWLHDNQTLLASQLDFVT